MNTSIFDVVSGSQWGMLLQNIDENVECDESHGTLISSEETFSIKVLNPETRQEVILNLEDIVNISKAMLRKEEGNSIIKDRNIKAVNEGLKHLEGVIRANVEKRKFYGKSSFSEAVEFYGEREEISTTLEETPDSRQKRQMVELTNHPLEHHHIVEVREMVRHDKNLLFDLTDAHESFFHLAWARSSLEDLVPFLEDVLMEIPSLERVHVSKLKQFIFDVKLKDNSSLFPVLMQGERANQIFDILLKVVTEDELNSDPNKKEQILDFAHTMKRYEYIFLKPEDLLITTHEAAEKSFKEFQLLFEESIKDDLSSKKSTAYSKWLELRYASSTTLSQGDPSKMQASIQRWMKAEESRSFYVSRDKGSTRWVDMSNMQTIHRKLCAGEEGIKNPGQIRTGIVRTSGGWSHIYCPTRYLNGNVERFWGWFNEGLIQCENKERNPIIFAAQTYQRCVSLHPFENGNGRVSRFLMDYVLERFHLPPPILGKNVLDAVFPMDVPQHVQDQFIIKIIQGIEKSKDLLSS